MAYTNPWLAKAGITAFPYAMTPMNNITPLTYRDGITYLKMLEQLSLWVRDTVAVEFQDVVEKAFTDFEAGIKNAEDTVIQSKNEWQGFFDEFISNVVVELEGLNDGAVANLVLRDGSALDEALKSIYLTNETFDAFSQDVTTKLTDQETKIESNKKVVDSAISLVIETVDSDRTNSVVTTYNAIVTTVSPLKVIIDGESVSKNATTLISDLIIGQRVRCMQQSDNLVVTFRDDTQLIDWRAIAPQMRGNPGTKLNIPTHVTPSGGQSVHPSVVKFEEPWNGYRYWMAHTPYPGGVDSNEDPNICASNDGITWVVPTGLVNPLDDAPGSPKYNSDTDLVFALGKLWCFWRYRDTTAGATSERIYVRTSTNGISWTTKDIVYQSNMSDLALVSPSLIFDGSKWIMYAVDIAPSTFVVKRLISSGNSPLLGQWGSPVECTFPEIPASDPWHIEVRLLNGTFVALLNTSLREAGGSGGNLYLRTSPQGNGRMFDGSKYRVIPQSSDDHTAVYRATFIPEIVGGVVVLRIWYSAQIIKEGSPSVWNIFNTYAVLSSNDGAYAMASGPIPPQSIIVGGTMRPIVKFPPGRFTAPPMVLVSLSDNVKELTISASNTFTNQFTASIAGTNTSTVVAGGRYVAIQMLPLSNEG